MTKHLWTYEYDNDGNGRYSRWYNIKEDDLTVAKVLGDNEELAIVFCRMMKLIDGVDSAPYPVNRLDVIEWFALLA